jgi:hypothetical protein
MDSGRGERLCGREAFVNQEPITTAAALVPPRPTLRTLKQAAAGCRACPLWERGTQTVFGEGLPDSRVILVGEQPGDDEDRQGVPFVGPAGRILDQALDAAGIDRKDAYVTNVVKHFKWVAKAGSAFTRSRTSVRSGRACPGRGDRSDSAGRSSRHGRNRSPGAPRKQGAGHPRSRPLPRKQIRPSYPRHHPSLRVLRIRPIGSLSKAAGLPDGPLQDVEAVIGFCKKDASRSAAMRTPGRSAALTRGASTAATGRIIRKASLSRGKPRSRRRRNIFGSYLRPHRGCYRGTGQKIRNSLYCARFAILVQ